MSSLRFGAVAALAVVLISCSDEPSTSEPVPPIAVTTTTTEPLVTSTTAPQATTTTTPATTTTAEPRPVVESLEALVDQAYSGGIGAVIVGVIGESSSSVAGIGEDGDGAAVDGDRPWHTASLAKVFTATAVLQLVDDGLVELDAPVANYVEFPVSDQITVRHVLQHRSGINDVGPVQCSDQSRADEIIEAAGLASEPLVANDYGNSNYVLLGLLIGSVTGEDPGDYIRDNVFTPVGMDSSYWYESQTGPTPWFRNIDSTESFGTYDCGEPGPTIGTDGAAITTVADMGAFYQGLFHGGLLEEETLSEMLKMDGQVFGDGYGLGIGQLTNEAFPDENLYGFGGDGGFFGTMAFHDPDKKRTYAMFFTQGDRMTILWDMVAWANQQDE